MLSQLQVSEGGVLFYSYTRAYISKRLLLPSRISICLITFPCSTKSSRFVERRIIPREIASCEFDTFDKATNNAWIWIFVDITIWTWLWLELIWRISRRMMHSRMKLVHEYMGVSKVLDRYTTTRFFFCFRANHGCKNKWEHLHGSQTRCFPAVRMKGIQRTHHERKLLSTHAGRHGPESFLPRPKCCPTWTRRRRVPFPERSYSSTYTKY